MSIVPVNRYIHIEIPQVDLPQRESGIVLPQDYAPTKERHAVATVKACAEDVRFREGCPPGTQIIIDQGMVEEIIVNNEKITVILDNYVIGIT